MRSEKEMMDLILDVAIQDAGIRTAVLSGSRANEKVEKDIYQDYDIAYFVKDVTPYYNNMAWIEEHFGKPAIMQLPELMGQPLLPPDKDGHFTYLMIFEDGNRIDLSVYSVPYIHNGEPAVILLDKDGTTGQVTVHPEFWNIQPPTADLYKDTCNEFWWCLNNVGKGIARKELPYTMSMLQQYVRDMLNQMVEWYIGIQTEFGLSAGKMGKYYSKYLPAGLYQKYEATYCDSNYSNMWKAVFTACELFHTLAEAVASHFGYCYNEMEEKAMLDYLHKVREHKFTQ